MDFFSDQNNLILIAVAIVSGLMLLWPMIQRQRGGAAIGTTQAVQMMNNQQATLVDIRPDSAYSTGHIPQSKHIPSSEIAQKTGSLAKDKPLILVCDRGVTAVGAAVKFRAQGFTSVFTLEGGINAWTQAGLPITTKKERT